MHGTSIYLWVQRQSMKSWSPCHRGLKHTLICINILNYWHFWQKSESLNINIYKGQNFTEVNLHTDLDQTVISHKVFNILSKCKALAEAKWIFSTFNTGSLPPWSSIPCKCLYTEILIFVRNVNNSVFFMHIKVQESDV